MSVTPTSPATMLRLLLPAIEAGDVAVPLQGPPLIPLSGDCDKPYIRHLVTQRPDVIPMVDMNRDIVYKVGHRRWTRRSTTRPPAVDIFTGRITAPFFFDIEVRCRKCEMCLKARQRLWSYRVRSEHAYAERSWWCTFTLNKHHRKLADEFGNPHKYINIQMTKALKRLRRVGHKLRYILVTEDHADGTPHLHAVFHELPGEMRIPKRAVERVWRGAGLGITSVELIRATSISDVAGYIGKYATKSAGRRVRSSKRYGQRPMPIACPF